MSDIYHLNCGPMQPPFTKATAVCHVVLLKTNSGWLLVDSGFGSHDLGRKRPLVVRIFQRMTGLKRNLEITAHSQVQRLGIDPHDVRDIILTHLHLDHAGGVADFPWARVHVYRREFEAALQRKGRIWIGYIQRQWKDHKNWVFYEEANDRWFNFTAIPIRTMEPSMFLIPTPGHTLGHCMVAIQRSEGWLLHGGDAIYPFFDPETRQSRPLPVLMKRTSFGLYIPELEKLRQTSSDPLEIISSHDYAGWKRNQPH